ncbi:remodeling and spacing factor 1-like isoform X1 [Branchiostoma floridae x Branchiostoma belcheri]
MSGPEKGVDTDPDYAVVCGFLRRYGEALGLPPMSYAELQRALEDTTRLNPDLIMMQVKLMRKIGKSVSSDKWERYLVKMCRQFSQIAAWEMEQGGYQEVDPNIKLKLLKYLCERQFDDNLKFRAEVLNKEEADAMREKPLGRDKNGMLYWYMQDADMNLHLYREEPDDQYNSTWQVVCRTRDELEGLIAELEGGGKDTADQEEEDDKSTSTDQASLAGKIKDKCTNGQYDEDKENKEEAQTDVKPKKESQLKEDKEDIKTATDDKPRKESQVKENRKDVQAATEDKSGKEETSKPITSQHVSVIVKREITPEPVKPEPTMSTSKEDEKMKKESVIVESSAGTSEKSATSSNQSEAKDKGETSKGGNKQQEPPPPPKPVSHVHKGIHSIENILRDVPIKCERDAITEPPRVVSASMDPTVGLQTFANGRIHYCMGEGSSMDSVPLQGEMGSQDGQKERRSPTEGGSTAKEEDKGANSREMSETAAVEEAKSKVREILSKNSLSNSSSNTDESSEARTANEREGQRSDVNNTGNKMPDSGKEMQTTKREQVSTNRVSDDKSESKKTEESRSSIEPEESRVKEKGEKEKKTETSPVNTTSESENNERESKEPEKQTEAAGEDVTKHGEKSPKPGKESEKPDKKEEEDPGNKTVDSCTSKDKPGKESKDPDMSAENTGEESKDSDAKPKKSEHPEEETEEDHKEDATEKDSLETSEDTTKPQRGRKRGRRGRKGLKGATKKPAKERDEDVEGKEEEGEELDDSRSVSKDSESSKEAVSSAPIRRSTRARKAVQQVYTPEVKKKPVTYPKEPSEPSLPPSPKPVKKSREKRGRGKRRGRRRKDSTSEEESEEEEEEEEDSSEEEESEYPTEDDSPCCKCGMYNHPEWILLCDKCDSGYHTACLRPPLMMIPDGDWFCPSCEHVQLVSKLREALAEVDQELKKKQRAERRKERLTYVGISLENVIPEPDPKSEMVGSDEEERIRPRHQHKKKKKQHHGHHRRRHHYYDDEKPVKTIAERRTSRRTRKDISYRFDDFDEVINEAIQEDIKASEGAGGYGGKDIENIIAAEGGVVKKEGPKKGRRRRLMDLDADSEEEVGSEEEYNMSEGSEQSEVEEEPSEPSEASLSDSEDSLAQRTRRRFQSRRSSKATRRSSRLRSGCKRRYWDSDEEEEDIDDEHSSVSSENIPRWSGVRTYSARRQKVCYKESSSSEEEKEKTKRSDLPDLEWEPESVREEGSPRRKRPRLESSSESESSSDETREEPKKPARRQLDTSESDDDEEEEEEEEKEKEETKDDQETKDQDEEEEDPKKKELSSEKDNKEQDTSAEGNKMGVSFQLPKVSKSMESSPTTDTLPLPAQMTQNGTHDSSGRSSRQSGEDEDELLANVMDLVAYVTEDD